jgi:leader peptidase (prepilin peptidase)/N-methyltransferase
MRDNLLIELSLPFVFLFGSVVGSFLNVVVYRIPAHLSLLYPPSRCPSCSHPLGITENIPILGWLRLRGRCRWCRQPISSRYPLVELLTALLFCLVFWTFELSIQTLAYWVLLSWLIVLSLIDLDTFTLPNILLKSGLVVGGCFQMIIGWQNHQLAQSIFVAVLGACLGLWLLDIIRIVGSFVLQTEAMGDGDPKLAALIGIWLGWKYLLVACFLACALGAILGIVGHLTGKLGKRQMIPFGPFLAIGASLTVFVGNEIISNYVKLFFPFS